MLKKAVILSLLVIFVFSLNGCAMGRKQKDLEMQGLRNQISVLEAQIQTKDEEINNLRDTLGKTSEQKQTLEKKRTGIEAKSRPKPKQIQIALRNAGYNPGAIDGKMGRQTKEAIKQFQKDNNLGVDGKVGKKTWDLLRGYLEKRVK